MSITDNKGFNDVTGATSIEMLTDSTNHILEDSDNSITHDKTLSSSTTSPSPANTDVHIGIHAPNSVTGITPPLFNVTWRNIQYTVKIQKNAGLLAGLKRTKKPTPEEAAKPQTKDILKDVSGYCLSGQLQAIMGASGSGKTSLLNVLAGRNKLYTGELLVNGQRVTSQTKKRISFIQQTDLFFKELTVTEHLSFQAALRLPKTMSKEQRDQMVTDVVHELGLTKVAHNRIGMVGQNGISGGERRRLALATELLTNPSVLLLDEPTSGLDSFMAEEVVSILKQLTSKGRTVVCTIHQPSSQLYAMFDSVMYLAEGRVAYSGPLNNVVPYFAELNYVCPSYVNPADYFIKQLSTVPSNIDASKAQVSKLLEEYNNSSKHVDTLKVIDTVVAENQHATPVITPKSSTSRGSVSSKEDPDFNNSWLRQFAVLLHRSALNIRRDPMLFKARMGQSLILGILAGLIWLQLGNGQTSVQDRVGVLFFFILSQAMGNIMQMLTLFPLEMPVFAREYQAGMCRTDTYFLAKNISELPFQVMFPIIFSTIAYWMIDLSSSATKWIEITALNVLISQSALSLGYAVSAGSPSVQVSLVLGPLLLMPFMIFGGLLINTQSIPNYFYWLSYTSFVRYGYEAMNLVLWRDTVIECNAGEICSYRIGDDVLRAYGWKSSEMGECIGALLALAVGFRVLAWMLLWRRVQKTNA